MLSNRALVRLIRLDGLIGSYVLMTSFIEFLSGRIEDYLWLLFTCIGLVGRELSLGWFLISGWGFVKFFNCFWAKCSFSSMTASLRLRIFLDLARWTGF